MELKPGICGELTATVTPAQSAKAAFSGELDVFGTPFVIALMEQTADRCVRPYLEEGYATVGTQVNINHIAATPIGMEVRGVARLTEAEGRKLTFEVYVYDSVSLVAEGTHQRFIVHKEKFMEKANRRGGEPV